MSFKIRDKVTVYRKVTQAKRWNNTWPPIMDRYIGLSSTIISISRTGILLQNSGWYQSPPCSLKYTKEKHGT